MQTSTSVLVSGQPGAGKTSMLSALLAAIPPNRCIRSCEEIRELQVPITHGSFYEARPPGTDETAGVTLRELVRFCLSMRPDYLVVGEVRGAEAFELTRAVNAGCGFGCTVHANSAPDALSALVNAAIMAGENVGEAIVRKVFAAALDLVVHCDMVDDPDGDRGGIVREVTEIVTVVPSLHDDFSTEALFVRDGIGRPLQWTGALPARHEAIGRALPTAMPLAAILDGRVSPL